MVATLSKNAAGTSWSIGNQRSYDVWGGVRSGSATGGPKQRYCANLGHVHDDESRLIYMRARYYEPGSGRFISEDRKMQGENWFVYARNCPSVMNDPCGNLFERAIVGLLKFLLGNILLGNIDELVIRLDTLTKYMNQLDDLMTIEKTLGTYGHKQFSNDAMEIRNEVRQIHNKLRRLKAAYGVLNVGSRLGKGLDKLLQGIGGYCLVISALIDDVYLAADGYGSLEGVFGG
jgi:RHS repeat-associated protein